MRKTHLLLAATGAAVVGIGGPAFAGAPHAYTAVTHTSDHPDTTSVANTCAPVSDNGPVWAYDNLSLRFSVSPETTANTYSVTITAHGSFREVADPTTGVCTDGHGSVSGWIQYDVYSSTAPDRGNLPAQEPGDVHQTAILSQLFGGNAQIVGGGHYNYTYNKVAGAKYTQAG